MIRGSQIPTHGPGCVPADAIRYQPFSLFGDVERTTNLPAKCNRGLACTGGRATFHRRARTSLCGRHRLTSSLLKLNVTTFPDYFVHPLSTPPPPALLP